MNVKTILSTADDAYIIKNMYPLYLHDLSQYIGQAPNEHGILEPTPVRTLAEQGEVYNIWWTKPEALYPFVIQADGKVAGFALVARPPHIPDPAADYMLHEFFLMHAYRGTGVAAQAATEILNRFCGRWYIEVLSSNHRARSFWRNVLRQFGYEERATWIEDSPHRVYRFDNSKASQGATGQSSQ